MNDKSVSPLSQCLRRGNQVLLVVFCAFGMSAVNAQPKAVVRTQTDSTPIAPALPPSNANAASVPASTRDLNSERTQPRTFKKSVQDVMSAIGSPVKKIIQPTISAVKSFADDPLQSMPPELANQEQAEAQFRVSNCKDSFTLPDKLDLLETIDIALCNNPKAKQSWAAMKGRAAEIGQRRGAYLPTINATATLERTTTFTNENAAPTNDNINVNRTLTASLSWRVFDFGTRAANLAGTRYLLQSAFFEHDTNIQSALTAVIQAYFKAQTSRAQWQSLLKSETFLQQVYDASLRRQKAGVAAANEVLRAEASLRRTQVDKAEAWSDYQADLVSLIFAMAAQSPIRENMDLVESLDVDRQDGDIGELEQWVKLIREEHPTVKSFRAAIASYDEQIKAQRASKLPYLDVSVNASRSLPMQASLFGGGKSTTSAATATLTVPIFEGFIPHYQVKALELQKEGTIARRDEILTTLFRDVSLAYMGAKAAFKRLDATANLVSVNQRNVASTQRRYDAGLAPVTDVLNAQSDLALAELRRIQNVYEWKQTRLTLLSSAAVLDKTDYTPGSALVENLKPKWTLNNPYASTQVNTTLFPQAQPAPTWKNAEDFMPAPPRRPSSLPAPLGNLNRPQTNPNATIPIGVIRTIPQN